MENEEKFMLLEVSGELIIEFLKGLKRGFKGNFSIIENGLPEDAELVDYTTKDAIRESSPWPHTVIMKIRSKEFAPIKAGDLIPFMDSPVAKAVQE